MRRCSTLVTAMALVGLAGAAEARAQSASALRESPGVVTLRYYQCGESQLGAAAAILGGGWRGIAEELIAEGLLLDYQIWTRTWGDEWNLIEYYAAADEEAFRYALEEIELRYRVTEEARTGTRRLDTLCSRRKDSQYASLPPA